MADNLITPEFRAGYISIFKAKAQKNEDGTMGAAKFSVRACFPPTTDMSALKAAAASVLPPTPPKSFRSPFRKNEELDNPVAGIGDDWIIMTFSANEDSRPGLVDHKRDDIIDDSAVYSGAWFRAQVRPYWYEKKGNKGVAFGLQNVQKLRDDEPLGKGKVPASKAFSSVEGAAQTSNAAALFD